MGTIVHLRRLAALGPAHGSERHHARSVPICGAFRAGTPQPFCGLWRWIGVPGSNRMAH
jgi:hypothetical protein